MYWDRLVASAAGCRAVRALPGPGKDERNTQRLQDMKLETRLLLTNPLSVENTNFLEIIRCQLMAPRKVALIAWANFGAPEGKGDLTC